MGVPFDGVGEGAVASAPARLHGIGGLGWMRGSEPEQRTPALPPRSGLLPLTIIKIYS